MLVIVLIVLALVAFALLWRWTAPTNPVRTPDDHRPQRVPDSDPVAEQSRQESDASIAPWIGGSGS
jgi:hypothetical protein